MPCFQPWSAPSAAAVGTGGVSSSIISWCWSAVVGHGVHGPLAMRRMLLLQVPPALPFSSRAAALLNPPVRVGTLLWFLPDVRPSLPSRLLPGPPSLRMMSASMWANMLGFMLFGTAFYLLAAYVRWFVKNKSMPSGVRRALLVIAHPDDECMFFGPTLVRITSHAQVYVLCLSPGNYYNQGHVRKGELWKSCKELGVPEENVTLLRHTKMSDDPEVVWSPEKISRIILDYVHKLEIDTLLTFDKGGVSGHRNHSSIYHAVSYLCLHEQLPQYCSSYVLKSVNVLRKYSLHLDVPLSYLFSPYVYVATLRDRQKIQGAMQHHASQYVWFRKLYMQFSRYTVLNTWKRMPQELPIKPEIMANGRL